MKPGTARSALILATALTLSTLPASPALANHTDFQGGCNSTSSTRSSWTKSEARAYASVAIGDGYQWGGGCWNGDGIDQSPGDAHEDDTTRGEGGDCSGFTNKTWALPEGGATTGFIYRDKMNNYHGSGTEPMWSSNAPGYQHIDATAVVVMDGLINPGSHIGMVYSSQKDANGNDYMIEAKGEDYGTGAWFRNYRYSGYLGLRRPGWTPESTLQSAANLSAWTTVRGATGGPDATSWADGRIDMVTRNASGNLIHLYYERGVTSTFAPGGEGENLGGVLSDDPTIVAPTDGVLDIVGRNTAGNPVYKHYSRATGWAAYRTFDGTMAGGPDVSSWDSTRLDLFIRSSTGGHLYHRWSSDSGTTWAAWEDLTTRLDGPIINSDPAAVSWDANRIDVVARGSGNDLVHYYYDPNNVGIASTHWTTEIRPADITSSPDVASWGSGRLDIAARWSDGQLAHTWFDRANDPMWAPKWEGWGEAPTTAPAAVDMAVGRHDEFVGSGGSIKQRYFQG